MPAGQSPDDLRRALDRLEQFLDTELSGRERADALNDPSVPVPVLYAFLRALGRWDRVMALALCWRPAVLAAWVDEADDVELNEIAGNPCTPIEIVHRLLADEPDEGLRIHLAQGQCDNADLAAWFLTDKSALVRDALRTSLDELREWKEGKADQHSDATTVDWLHEAVPATEIEDLLEQHAYEQIERVIWAEPDESDPDAQPDDAPSYDPHLESAVALLEMVFGPGRVLGD